MYESPVDIIYGEMQTQIDNEIMQVVQDYNIVVDKEELIKALNYDRHQYDKGFADGQKASQQWIPVSERPPKEVGTYMTTVDYEKHGLAVGQRYYHGKGLGWEDDCVIAWMPLPEPMEVRE